MAAHARAAGVALRPHAKTHKSRGDRAPPGRGGRARHLLRHAGRGRGDGARRHSRRSHHLAAGDRAQDRAPRRLNGAAHRGLSVVVDHPANLAALDRGGARGGTGARRARRFRGRAGPHRRRRRGGARVAGRARRARAEGFAFRGIQSYSGNLQHVAVRAERARPRAGAGASARRDGRAPARATASRCRSSPAAAPARSISIPRRRVFTELQVGSYVFMDVHYQRRARRRRATRRRSRPRSSSRPRWSASTRRAMSRPTPASNASPPTARRR